MIEKIERDGKVLLQITQETEVQNLSAMAERNEIHGLLFVKHFRIDGESVFQYDITGLESMKERYCRLEISENELEEMICQISAIIRNAKEWLLEESEFLYAGNDLLS